MIERSSVIEVRENLKNCVGQKVLLRGSLGRNKTFEKEGTLLNAYSNNFLVEIDNGMQKTSYSYVDVLTNTIQLGVSKNGGYSSILDLPC